MSEASSIATTASVFGSCGRLRVVSFFEGGVTESSTASGPRFVACWEA